ncbi:hypothetical protein DFH09DRAFT_1104292 [Mycena vulgaris]|nr:hypothetical protein DFH09DRAFT_1104292 [Mycena vulgaris]
MAVATEAVLECERVFRIPELCDHIVENVALHSSSAADLKAIALVCQTLAIAAQSQIFRHIIVDPYLPFRPSHRNLNAAVSALHRLSAILTTSPHLLRFIHRLSIYAKPEILASASRIEFPVLQKLHLRFLDPKDPHEDALLLVRDLIGLPSIREVEIQDMGNYQELNWDFFTSLFETCTPNLRSVCSDPKAEVAVHSCTRGLVHFPRMPIRPNSLG